MTLGLCVSPELRDLLLAYGVPESKLRVFRLGIDLSDFHPSEKPTDSFRVAMVGRFIEKKGFEYGLRAFARFLASGRRGTLVVVGEGELGARLHDVARSLGIDEHVEWKGWIPPVAVASVLARTHVLFAPSVVGQDGDREGCPMVVQEACASGVVVVASRHGGLPDAVVHGETGFLAPEHDDDALARYLGALSDDADLRQRMASAGLAKMQRERDVDERVASLEAHYDEARAAFRGEHSLGPDLGTRRITPQ
jgi:glycosyltransferase involved in cell wall biosynthesis